MGERTTDDSTDWELEEDPPVATGSLTAAVEPACLAMLDQLHEQAVQWVTGYMEAMLRAREAHPYRERGSIGVRVRRSPAPRSAPGVFMIEWFRVRGRHRTDYLPRGAGHRYSLRAFGRIEPWERELIETYEPRFAEIRALQHQIGTLRRQARHLTVASERWQRAVVESGLTSGA